MLSLLLLGAVATLTTDAAAPSSFYLACMQAGGTAGSVEIKSASNKLRIYSAAPARISLMFPAADGINSINIVRTPAPAGEATSLTMYPNQGLVFTASQVMIESMGGTIGKSIEYCLRAN